tara:strand:+ start:2688 stop:3290 length:603 start_codon:yes stop_codon:yes gene_type:complete
MVLNKSKIKRKTLIQISLVFFGLLIIFFTYFYSGDKDTSLDKVVENKIDKDAIEKEGFNTFENITYEGKDSNDNDFILKSEYAEFATNESNIIYMKKIICRFFFKDGTILKVISDKGVYDNISNDMEFEENVEMYYLANKLFSDKANFVNSESYLIVQGNVVGEGPLGNVAADKLNVDLIDQKMKISMYNESKVNIKVNY